MLIANLKFDSTYAADDMNKCLLAINFENEASVDLPEAAFGPKKKVHIFGNTAIQLAESTNLKIDSGGGYNPILAAYSYNDTKDYTVSVAVRTLAGNNSVEISAPSKMYCLSDGAQCATTAIFGNANASYAGGITVKGGNRYDIGDKNVFVARSIAKGNGGAYCFASAVVIGAAWDGMYSGVETGGGNIYTIGNENIFVSCASSQKDAATAIIGVAEAVAVGDKAVAGGDGIYDIGNDNSFIAYGRSSSVVFGAAGYRGNTATKGGNSYNFGRDNVFTAYSETSASVFGAARYVWDTTASGQSITMNGSQTIGALSEGRSGCAVHTFGAYNTNITEENKYGWRIGFCNITDEGTAVNILGARGVVTFTNETTDSPDDSSDSSNIENRLAKVTLNGNAHAFALGEDFQIYFGGKSKIIRNLETKELYVPDEFEEQFETIDGSGIANIFGAIAPTKNAKLTNGYCKNSRLTVDSGWTVNLYGPIEGLESIKVRKGTLNVYGSLRNITLDEGKLHTYGTSDNIGTIILKNGVLRIGTCDNNGAVTALNNMTKSRDPLNPNSSAPVLKFADLDNQAEICPVATIDSEKYVENFGTKGKLVVGNNQNVVYYIDPDKKDPNNPGYIGCSYIETTSPSSFSLQGGSLVIKNISNAAFDPDTMWLALVQGKGIAPDQLIEGLNTEALEPVKGEKNTWVLYSGTFPAEIEGLCKFSYEGTEGESGLVSDILIKGDEYGSLITVGNRLPDSTIIKEEPDIPLVNIGLAKADSAIISMFRNSLDARLSDVKGNSDDPFIAVLGGHIHQNALSGIGYSGDVYGVSCGADKFIQLKSGNYLRIGGALGYAHGSIDFHGPAVPAAQTDRQNNLLLAGFCAYEAFDNKNLKTDFNLFFGWGYGRHHLSRTDAQAARYTAKTRAYSGFISAELIRNMYKLGGFQIGPWLKADYHHVQHNGYSENGGANSQSVSKAKFDSFNTTIGLSIEKELQNILKSDSRLKIFAKAGWNCQPLRSHSTILSTIGGNCIIVPVDFGSRNAAVITAGMRYKINSNFDLTTQWNGIFSKDTTTNSLSIGLGYTF